VEINWHTVSIIGSILGSVGVLSKLIWDVGRTQNTMRTNELKHIEDKLDHNTRITEKIGDRLENHIEWHLQERK
jgi:hypothetical protein